jgi:glycopeptide antibiotics resistance protein
MDTNSLAASLLATVFVALIVFVLPLADRAVCRRLGVNLHRGLSANPDADRILRLRKRLLTAGVVLYFMMFAWLVFFSRSASEYYAVHVAPLENLKNAFSTPTGFSGWFRTLFTEGFSSAFSQISIVRPEDISQFYLNMVLFIPMGYLLPYVFRWFRARVNTRPWLFCLLVSLLAENLQLITRRGMYDLDDIISNTLGGFIGQLLYVGIAYVLTHPGWREDLRAYRRWRRVASRRTVLPFVRETGLYRFTLLGSDGEAVREFYGGLLGFRLRGCLPREADGETLYLFEMDQNQVLIACSPDARIPEKQFLTLSAVNLPDVRKRLEGSGISPGPYAEDPSTGRRIMAFDGPDNTRIEIIEAD